MGREEKLSEFFVTVFTAKGQTTLLKKGGETAEKTSEFLVLVSPAENVGQLPTLQLMFQDGCCKNWIQQR